MRGINSYSVVVLAAFGLCLGASEAMAGMMYWKSTFPDQQNKMWRAHLDGSIVRTVTLGNPGNPPFGRSFCIDPKRGTVFIAFAGVTIERLNLGDGSYVRPTVNCSTSSQYVPLNGANLESLALNPHETFDEGEVYWTNRTEGKIQRGPTPADLVMGLTSPWGIALDLAFNRIYWTDSGTQKIQRANLDGSFVEDLVTTGLVQPEDIAIDPVNGKMYWNDPGTNKIQRANLIIPAGETAANRTDIEDLVTGLTQSAAIALDIVAGKLYWIDQGALKIRRANLDGTNPEDIVVGITPSSRELVIIPEDTMASPGDMNRDGVVNGDDLQAFVDRLVNR